MKIRSGIKYIAFTAVAYAVFDLILSSSIHRGLDLPQKHPFQRNTWIVDKRVLSDHEWLDLQQKSLIAATTWVFITSGTSFVLPSDFNTSANQIDAIGAGVGGAGGTGGGPGTQGNGGNGGGAGAFAQIVNYSGHGPGQTVSIQVGTGDTIWDSSSVLLAKAGSGSSGGTAASSVGSTKFNGGGGGNGEFGGGGGGGAGGPHGAGNSGTNGSFALFGNNGTGGTGDAGNTAADANGAQFGPNASSQFVGSGGGGDGGLGQSSGNGNAGSNAGFYGAGGGGGGGGAATCSMGFCTTNGGAGGNGTQGLIAISYTPLSGVGGTGGTFLSGYGGGGGGGGQGISGGGAGGTGAPGIIVITYTSTAFGAWIPDTPFLIDKPPRQLTTNRNAAFQHTDDFKTFPPPSIFGVWTPDIAPTYRIYAKGHINAVQQDVQLWFPTTLPSAPFGAWTPDIPPTYRTYSMGHINAIQQHYDVWFPTQLPPPTPTSYTDTGPAGQVGTEAGPGTGLTGTLVSAQKFLEGQLAGVTGIGVTTSFDPATVAILSAFTTIPSTARQLLINNLVVTLKNAGIWSLLDFFYIFAAANSQASLVNWKNPGAFSATVVNSPTFTVDRGYTFDGATNFVDTNFNPSSASGNYSLNSASFSAWLLTNNFGNFAGRFDGTNTFVISAFTPNVFVRINEVNATNPETIVSTASGLFVGNRSASNALQVYINGSQVFSDTSSSSIIPVGDCLIGTVGGGFFATAGAQCAGSSMGSSLTSVQATALYEAEAAYMRSVGAIT